MEQTGVQTVVNMKHLDTLQLIQHLSSRGAPVTALRTIAKELLNGRVWINILAAPTATDMLSKFFGVTSTIHQMKLITDVTESIEIDESETHRKADQSLREQASEERQSREDEKETQGISKLLMPCPRIPKPRSGEAGINSGIFYAWGRTVTMWLKLKSSRLAEVATAVFEGEDQAIDLSAIMRDSHPAETSLDGLLAAAMNTSVDPVLASYITTETSVKINWFYTGLRMCQVIRAQLDRKTSSSRAILMSSLMNEPAITEPSSLGLYLTDLDGLLEGIVRHGAQADDSMIELVMLRCCNTLLTRADLNVHMFMVHEAINKQPGDVAALRFALNDAAVKMAHLKPTKIKPEKAPHTGQGKKEPGRGKIRTYTRLSIIHS